MFQIKNIKTVDRKIEKSFLVSFINCFYHKKMIIYEILCIDIRFIKYFFNLTTLHSSKIKSKKFQVSIDLKIFIKIKRNF